MDYSSNTRHHNRSNLSQYIPDYDTNTISHTNINKGKKDILLKSGNNYSVLKHNYGDGKLKNISINFGFDNSKNKYKYKNNFPLSRYPIYEQRNIFYYDKNFQLFKNKSVSKYGERKFKNQSSTDLTKNQRYFSPQHKIVTSIKKKKLFDTDDKINNKKEKDVYEVEVVNTVLYDDEDNIDKKEFINDEWGEIEHEIYENEKNKNNNLLNSVFVEIEKEDGDKQFKKLEISKDEKKPCIKIKYTIEDKICLNAANDAGGDDLVSIYDKDTKESVIRSPNYRTDTTSTYNRFNNSNINLSSNSLERSVGTTNLRNVSNILKESKTTKNLHSSRDNLYSSVSIPSIENYQRYSNYKQLYEKPNKTIQTGTYHTDKSYETSQNRLYKDTTEEIMNRYSIRSESGKDFNNNNYLEIKSTKKNNEFGIKTPTPRDNKEEIQIKIESGLNSLRVPLTDEKKDFSIHSPGFSFVGSSIDDITKSIRDRYGDKSKKESIAESQIKIINKELNKTKLGIKKYNNLSGRVSPKRTEIQKYKKEKEKKGNNYFLLKQKSIDNVLSNINNQNVSKSQYLKTTIETEKPITTKNIMTKSRFDEIDSKNSFLRPFMSDTNFSIKKKEDKSDSILSRYNIYQTGGKEKKDNYLTERKEAFKPRFDTTVNIEGLNLKKEVFKRPLAETKKIGVQILPRKVLTSSKSEANLAERQRLNAYQNKIQIDHSIGSIINIGSIGKMREKEEKERKEKERREREKLQIEKEMERMEKERERQRKEREKEKEKEREKEILER